MREEFLVTLAVIAIATAASHALSGRLRLPMAIFLLGAGIIAGPELLGWVKPESFGDLLEPTLALTVAVVVFEGAFSLDNRSLRLVSRGVRNLVTVGALMTILAGTLTAHYLLDFGWRLALEFGTLISVTGPAVIAPILQRVRVNNHVRATLMGEAVLIDPLGAMAAVVALQVLEAEVVNPAGPAWWVIQRLGAGLAVGAVTGLVAGWGLRRAGGRLASDETWLGILALALGVFAVSERLLDESGLVAVVGLGLILGNSHVPHEREVRRYDDAVSVLVVGAIFVVLAARLQFSDIRDLGWEGLVAVAVVVFAVRPLVVLLSTVGSGLYWRERAYIAAIGPRGVVAASFATFAAVRLEDRGFEGGSALVGLVFLTILVSVVVQSAWAEPLAHVLRVRPLQVIIAGAGRVGRLLAKRLMDDREAVIVIDADEEAIEQATKEGLKVIEGDVTKAATLEAAGIKEAKAFVATTANDEDNLFACQLALTKYNVTNVASLISDPEHLPAFQERGIRTMNAVSAAANALDNLLRRPNLWAIMGEGSKRHVVEEVVRPGPALGRRLHELRLPGDTLILLVRRAGELIVAHGDTRLETGDVVTLMGEGDDLDFSRRVLAGDVEPDQAAARP